MTRSAVTGAGFSCAHPGHRPHPLYAAALSIYFYIDNIKNKIIYIKTIFYSHRQPAGHLGKGRTSTRSRLALLVASTLLGGCANLGYYGQLARGQHELLRLREPIARLLQDESRDARLRERLGQVQDARAWASAQLALPDNGSYTGYVQLDRPYVVWNVFAAPEFSLAPKQHCFPFAGCVAYRGYFSREGAEAEAARQRAAGLETQVSGVPAYSTLGWFDDPVLSSMMRGDDETLIGTLFHELAHQQLYLKDDSAFNESFASFVEQEGLRQYRAARGWQDSRHEQRKQRQRQFVQLVLATRSRLAALYRESLPASDMRARKRAEFERLQHEYRALRDGDWSGDAAYDRWFAQVLNNASLLPFGLYDQWVPAFAALHAQQGGDWPAFYRAVESLSKQSQPERLRSLQRLAAPQDAVNRL